MQEVYLMVGRTLLLDDASVVSAALRMENENGMLMIPRACAYR